MNKQNIVLLAFFFGGSDTPQYPCGWELITVQRINEWDRGSYSPSRLCKKLKKENIVENKTLERKIKKDEEKQLVCWDLTKQEDGKFNWFPSGIVSVQMGIYRCLYQIEYIYNKRLKMFSKESLITPIYSITSSGAVVEILGNNWEAEETK